MRHHASNRGGVAIFTNGNLWSPFNLPATLTAGRVRIEGVELPGTLDDPARLRARLFSDFRVTRLESYDYSYVPIMPLKFAACLAGRPYQPPTRIG